MTSPFLSSEEYDERAHALYNEAKYDEALELLRDGLALYPNAVELHVGVGYARLARDEFAWARRSFEEALVLDPEHEDALAGLGEVLLKFGSIEQGMRAFDRTIALGYSDDIDLMLQIGRALFREGFVEQALAFFERGAQQSADSAEAQACIGYALHRLGRDADATAALLRSLELDPGFVEARVYLANLMFDAGRREEALVEFEKTNPEDHWDELGIWRFIELKKGAHGISDEDETIKPWEQRLEQISGEPDAIDELLAEVEQRVIEQEGESLAQSKTHLEALGTLLNGLAEQHEHEATQTDVLASDGMHSIELRDGRMVEGTWEEIVQLLCDSRASGQPVEEFMARESRRHYGATGVRIDTQGAEAFIRGSADAGLFRIVR